MVPRLPADVPRDWSKCSTRAAVPGPCPGALSRGLVCSGGRCRGRWAVQLQQRKLILLPGAVTGCQRGGEGPHGG